MKRPILYPVVLFLFLLIHPFASSASTYEWYGTAGDNQWTNKLNWRVLGGIFGNTPLTAATPPTATDDVIIGVNYTSASSLTPNVTTSVSCASVSFGTLQSSTLTVTASGVLTVSGAIKQLPSAIKISLLGSNVISSNITGAGTVNCASVQAGDPITALNVTAIYNNFVQIVSTVNSLNVTGNINVYSTAYVLLFIPLGFNNAIFTLRAGTATVNGQILTSTHFIGLLPIGTLVAATSTFTVDMPTGTSTSPTLRLANVNALDPACIAGSVDFYNNTGGTGTATLEYAGAADQTVYSDTEGILNHAPSTYQGIGFSGAGKKKIQAGNLLISGNWTSNGGNVDAISTNPTVVFQGTTQTLTDGGSNGGAGVVFKNIVFQGGSTKTITSGAFSIYDIGILTVTANSTLAAGSGNLTFLSDEVGSASLAAVPAGSAVTGTVKVQRFIKGSGTNLTKRNYRLVSSPVYTAKVGGRRVFDMSYLLANTYLAGAAGGGFSSPNGNNPTLYLYREDILPSNTTFTSGPWKGISKINNTPVYNIGTQTRDNKSNVTDTTVNLFVGNGFIFYFIGDKSDNITQAGSKTTAPFDYPEDVTFTQPGTLNTGTVNVRLWHKPDTILAYTNNSLANSTIRGYCLVGNPYASTINWEKFNRGTILNQSSIYGRGFADAATQPGKIWVFNPSTRQFDTYMQKTGSVSAADTTTTVNPSAMVTGAASNMIASGQAFFIKATNANQSLSFRETAKTTTQPTSSKLIQLMGLPKEFTVASDPVLGLKMRMDSINTDEALIGFNDKCSATFVDDEDAEDLGGNGALVSLSVQSADSVNLAISRQPLPQNSQTNPLYVSSKSSGLYTLELAKDMNVPTVYDVWLMDAFTKDSLDMRVNKIYNFNIDKSNPDTYGSKRFSLVIRKNAALGIHLLNFTASKVSTAVKTTWKVENEFNYTNFSLERSTDGGKTFETQSSMASTGAGDYSYTDKFPVTGQNIYRLKLNYLNGQISYSKTIAIDFSATNNLANNLNVFPNPTTSYINFMMPADDKGITPSYSVQIINSSGSVMKKTSSADPHWQNNVSDLSPGTYVIKVMNNKDQSVWGISKFVKN